MFGQYVPEDHINKLIENPKQISNYGERREMTVLFSDIREFTALSEHLSSKDLKLFLNQYLTPITEVIFKHQGTIDKYVGDLVMAFWGAPLKDPEHAQHAVQSALKMQDKIDQLQADFSNLGLAKVHAGIGINTGEMNVGDMGSDYRRAYTVLGDSVNLGSRIEGLTKYYDIPILVSEETKKRCANITFRFIDNVRVKGKQNSVKIYQPIGLDKDISKEHKHRLNLHELALKKYFDGDWKEAADLLKQQYDLAQETICKIFLDRINENQNHPPKNWNGIYHHVEK